jgi:integrase
MLQERVAKGEDPALERAAVGTVAELIEQYVERHARHLRDARNEERLLRKDVLPALGHLKLDQVRRRQVADLVSAIATRSRAEGRKGVTANRVLGAMSRLFNKAVAWGLIEHSPAERVVMPVAETPRDRVLSDVEVARLWSLLDHMPDERMRRALRLALLTGARIGEVVGIRLEELHLDRALWLLPAQRSKNKRSHECRSRRWRSRLWRRPYRQQTGT